MGKQDFKEIKLAKGEVILKNCDYLKQEGGDFMQQSSLMLTNKRFIHRSIFQKKKEKSISIEEVNIDDIDSLDYGFTQAKNPVNPIIIVLFCLLFVAGIALFIVMKKPVFLLASLLGIIILLFGILLRKRTSAFNINVISYNNQNDHLCLDEHKDIEDTVEKKKSSYLLLVVLLLVFGGLGFLAYYFKDRVPIPNFFYIVIALLSVLYLFFLARILSSVNRGSKKVVKVDIPTKESKKKKAPKGGKDKKDNIDVDINVEGILDLINDMGALILNCKK